MATYEAELDAFCSRTLSKAYNGSAAPSLVLVSPIASALPLDVWNQGAAKTAMSRLEGLQDAVVDEQPMPPIPAHLTAAEQKQSITGHEIYFRAATVRLVTNPTARAAIPPSLRSWVAHG